MRLLLLDDDKVLGESASRRLRGDGHLVERFERLCDVKLLHCEAYDVLIVSLQLPDGSGLAWVAALRGCGVDTAALVLSEAYRSAVPVGTALAAGANDCLIKPVDLDLLAATSACLAPGSMGARGTSVFNTRVGPTAPSPAQRGRRNAGRGGQRDTGSFRTGWECSGHRWRCAGTSTTGLQQFGLTS
jgi:DNA-binding response OmpR family regulator